MKYQKISKWICSEGGSLIVINEHSALKWGGSSNADFESTFDFEDFVFQIGGYEGVAFFLGDEPLETAVVQIDDGSSLIIRWRWANSLDDVLKSLMLVELTKLKIVESAEIEINTGNYYLFDAASQFSEVDDSFLQLKIKDYVKHINTYVYEDKDLDLSLYIHTFN